MSRRIPSLVLPTLHTTPCILAALIAISGSLAEAATYIYGADVNNDIWELNPIDQTATMVITSTEIGQTANALAYNQDREHLFFVSSEVSTINYWERSTDTIKSVQGLPLGLTVDPNNAAFYNDALYFFGDDSNILWKAEISYIGDDPLTATPTVTSINRYAILGMSAFGVNANTFGDIAIDSNTGTLYANTSRGRIYTIDLPSPTISFREIVAWPGNDETVGLQLSFDELSSTLYGHNYSNGNWYTIDTFTGAITQIAGFNTITSRGSGFLDLGGAASTAFVASVPEPSGVMLTVFGAMGLLLRRRRS